MRDPSARAPKFSSLLSAAPGAPFGTPARAGSPLPLGVTGQPDPVAAGRAGELAEARALAEMALGALLAEWREPSAAKHTSDG
jgi:hypothetical protein